MQMYVKSPQELLKQFKRNSIEVASQGSIGSTKVKLKVRKFKRSLSRNKLKLKTIYHLKSSLQPKNFFNRTIKNSPIYRTFVERLDQSSFVVD